MFWLIQIHVSETLKRRSCNTLWKKPDGLLRKISIVFLCNTSFTAWCPDNWNPCVKKSLLFFNLNNCLEAVLGIPWGNRRSINLAFMVCCPRKSYIINKENSCDYALFCLWFGWNLLIQILPLYFLGHLSDSGELLLWVGWRPSYCTSCVNYWANINQIWYVASVGYMMYFFLWFRQN